MHEFSRDDRILMLIKTASEVKLATKMLRAKSLADPADNEFLIAFEISMTSSQPPLKL